MELLGHDRFTTERTVEAIVGRKVKRREDRATSTRSMLPHQRIGTLHAHGMAAWEHYPLDKKRVISMEDSVSSTDLVS